MIKCYAKINYTLHVLPKTPGEELHRIASIAPKISLCDEVTVRKNKSGKIHIICDDPSVPVNEDNLVYKVLAAYSKFDGNHQGYTVKIHKEIPVSAGLGGGSSDAAGALLEAISLGDVHYGYYQLLEIIKGLGSDVPQFFIHGTVQIEGQGEEITPIENKLDPYIVLVKPDFGVSSKEAYDAFDKNGTTTEKEDSILTDLREGAFKEAISKMTNDLEAPVLALRPELKEIKAKMKELGLPFVMLSGSGSCIFGLTQDQKIAEKVQKHFAEMHYFSKIVQKVG